VTHLYLIEHAAAMGYKKGRSTSVNPGLSPEGIAQAERLRERLAATGKIGGDVLISSHLARAKETAEIIAPALRLPVVIDEQCEEFRLGECEGLSDEEILQMRGGESFTLDEQPFRKVAPSGDSLATFRMRICATFDRITRDYEGKTVVIVCHGWVIETSFVYCLGLSMLKSWPIHVQSTSITHWYRDDGRRQWHLYRHADQAHWLQRPG
jgi:2,3-bisphosphoglycerate-dependent phosphoglycerate mutase